MVICSWSNAAGLSSFFNFWSVTILIFHGCRLRAEGAYLTSSIRLVDFLFRDYLPVEFLYRVTLHHNFFKLHVRFHQLQQSGLMYL